MPLNNVDTSLRVDPGLISGNSNRRVSMRLALEPNNTQHFDCTVNVSSRRADALYYANKAIDDTWRILDMGSGNQKNHVRATMAESYKRTLLSQKGTGNGDYTVRAWEASKFRAGNCGEMAAVNALLLANTRVKQPVSVVHNRDVDHAFVIIGDPRENGRSVVSDPWPEFGRAMRIEDAKFGDSYHVLHTYPVGHRDDDVREKLLRGEKATQAEVDKAFRKAAPKLAKLSPEKLRDSVVAGPGYVQRHASNNLGIQYDGTDSRGVVQHFDQSLSVGQMRSRMIGPQAAVDAQQRGTPAPTFTSNDRPRQRTESFAAESSSRGRRPRTASNAVPPAAPRRRANSVDIRPAPMPIYAPPPPAPGGMYSTVPLPGHAPAFNYGPPPAAAPVYSYGPPPAAAPVYSYGPPPVHAHAPVHAMASRPVYREPPVIPPDVYGTAPAPARTRPRSNSVTAAFRRIIGN
ncbi:hypothetical protein [Cedecea neteri]|uniref:hypothetical protein n=1 Tax=Cedecea neteri TaxID=158822 RepID=UPI002899652C|nr:hypothetical protein [Cedecea neteri]